MPWRTKDKHEEDDSSCFSILTVFTTNSCKQDRNNPPTPMAFTGKWSLVQIYGNDHWGVPAYWKAATANTKIQFTPGGKYYRKYPNNTTHERWHNFTS
jgi:hypothetical protein